MLTGWHQANSKEKLIELATKYGPMRDQLALKVQKALESDELTKGLWFIESGTLLGAWRNGKMIPHDDDFDMGIYVSNNVIEERFKGSKKKMLEGLCNFFREYSDFKFDARVVDSYVDKIEIYDPKEGWFWLNKDKSIDYHHVTVDLTIFYDHPSEKDCIQNSHKNLQHTCLKLDQMFPTREIVYNNMKFPAPRKPEEALTNIYGYLGQGAVFNPKTNLYEKAQPCQ